VQDKLDQARATVKMLESELGGQPKAELCAALANALVHAKAGNDAPARASLAAAVKLSAGSAALSVSLAHELVTSCFDHELGDIGSEMALNILRAASDERTVARTRELLRAKGLEQLALRIEAQIEAEVRHLVASGVKLARAGDFDGAIAAMMDAARKMPGHPVVIFNAALALLRHIEHRGWNHDLAHQARTLIERARALDPASKHIAELAGFMHLLIERDRLHASAPAPARCGA
jgi:hypothetical protein